MAELGMAFLNPILSQAENDRKEALLPLQIAHEAATTRLSNAYADRTDFELKGERATADILQKMIGGQAISGEPIPVSQILRGQALAYAQGGLPVKATQALEHAASAEAHEQVAAQNKREEAARVTSQNMAIAQKAASMLDSVAKAPDPAAAWVDFNNQVSTILGRPSPWKDQPYSPALVQQLRDLSMTSYQREELALRKAEADRRMKDSVSRNVDRALRDQLAREREDRLKAKAAADKKEGGKDVGAPTTGELAQAQAILKAQPGLVAPEDLDQVSIDVASQARELRRKGGMNQSEAIRSVIENMKKSGMLVPPEPGRKIPFTNIPIPGTEGKPSYRPGAGGGLKSKESGALPLPSSGNPKDLVKGQRYTDGEVVRTWTGSGWQ